jgi:predicted transcriptional regulator YdeE
LWLDKWDTPDHGAQWRAEEASMLEAAIESERRCVELAKAVLNGGEAPTVSPRIVRRGEITVTGLSGDGLRTAEVWNGFDAKYKEKPFARADSGGWEVRFYDGERPAVPGADVHVGFETSGGAPGDGYTSVTLPVSDYVVFDVLVRDGYESRNAVMNTWLTDNAGVYAQRMSDGTYYAVERYGERFKGDAPDSVAEIWIPIVRRGMA